MMLSGWSSSGNGMCSNGGGRPMIVSWRRMNPWAKVRRSRTLIFTIVSDWIFRRHPSNVFQTFLQNQPKLKNPEFIPRNFLPMIALVNQGPKFPIRDFFWVKWHMIFCGPVTLDFLVFRFKNRFFNFVIQLQIFYPIFAFSVVYGLFYNLFFSGTKIVQNPSV